MAWDTSTWTSTEVTAAQMNARVRDNAKAIGDAWTSFTPTIGNFTTGNGTIAAAYMQAGKLTTFRIKVTLGSSSAVTGSLTATLPANATATRTVSGLVMMYDSSAGASGYNGGWAFNSSTSTLLLRTDASATVNATVPFTWATGDELVITGTYEAA